MATVKVKRDTRSTTAPRSVDLMPVLDRLIYLAGVPPDWDGEGGEEPTRMAVATAAKLVIGTVQQLQERVGERALPYVLVPLSDGGIQVEWRTGALDLEVEVGPKGELGYLRVDHRGPTSYEAGEALSFGEALRLIGQPWA